ncbi:MAG: iron-containing alcohol dehydrogenase family protein [Salinirussus sp.]
MCLDTDPFVQDYQPAAIHFGRGCVANLGAAVADRGLETVLVVTGTNVGANPAVMDPITAGLDGRLADIFDKTTPEKRIETAYDVVDRYRESGADAIVAVGSGSSLDIARFVQVLEGDPRPVEAIRKEIETNGVPAVPETDLVPVFNVPTTFAGADLSVAAAVTYPTEDGTRAETIPVDDALMPTGVFYDPDLFETTPRGALTGSAMNGFDKALECVYSRHATPITDATAIRALQYLREALPHLLTADEPAVMERAVAGMLLAQYGVSRPEGYKLSVVHAFGHGLRNEFGLQQGIAHAVMVPHVLRLLFDHADGRRGALADGLLQGEQPADPDATATAVIDAVRDIRDGLELPTQLRELSGTDRSGLRRVAQLTHDDPFMDGTPPGFDPSVDDLEATLNDAW